MTAAVVSWGGTNRHVPLLRPAGRERAFCVHCVCVQAGSHLVTLKALPMISSAWPLAYTWPQHGVECVDTWDERGVAVGWGDAAGTEAAQRERLAA